MNILIWDVSQISPEKHLHKLTEDESEHLNKIKCPSTKNQKLGSILLQKYVAYKYFDIPWDKILFQINAFGKPSCSNMHPPAYHYNVSHDKNFVGIAFHKEYPVGLDIMEVKKIEVEHFLDCFTQYEKGIIGQDNFRFMLFWCIKEAYLKYLGTGLNKDMETIELLFDSNLPNELDQNDFTLLDVKLLDGNMETSINVKYAKIKNNIIILISEQNCDIILKNIFNISI